MFHHSPDDIRMISSFPAFSCLIPEHFRMFPLNDHRFSMEQPIFELSNPFLSSVTPISGFPHIFTYFHIFSMNNLCIFELSNKKKRDLARYQDLERRSARIYVHLEAPGKGTNPYASNGPQRPCQSMSCPKWSQNVPHVLRI